MAIPLDTQEGIPYWVPDAKRDAKMNAERQAVADIAIVWEQEGVAEREKEGRQASSHPQYRRISAPKEQPAEGDHMPRSA